MPPSLLKTRLSAMMFLQYAAWGAWLPFLWSFLSGHRGMDPGQIGDMFAAGAVGAIIGPFVAGQVADRYFSTERFLAFSHLRSLAIDTGLHDVVLADGAVVYMDVPSPESDSIPLFDFKSF